LLLTMLTCVQPGDEVLIADPYFVMYKHLVTLAGGTAKYIDTYPDFQLTVDRVAPQVTDRTKLLLFNSPSNPTGVIPPENVAAELAAFCAERGVLMLSDEIYDVFSYDNQSAIRPGRLSDPAKLGEGVVFPSPLHACPDVLLLRGFSKTYGMTGWRLGYAVGPTPIVEQMTKLQQYTFVCAPSMVQVAGALALDVDMSDHVAAYARKRDRVVERLDPHFELTVPGGAFYAFPKVPEALGQTATQFVERAIEKNVLVIPGNVFSQRDTHVRLSYACDDATLERGLDVLVELAQGSG
ncbi:MAG: aminotransferase class I/II-fold pyridoxal phosphate-dependent enzyme, partial [Planctomycetota bacterium]